MDRLYAEVRGADAAPLDTGPTPHDLAYVIFTSGSTGRPKGVAINHRGAANTVQDINARFRIGPGDRVLAISALSFDLSVYDVFGTLAAGATVVMPAPAGVHDSAHWRDLTERHGVTVWNSVPALMQLWVDGCASTGAPPGSKLRLALLSGDWIPVTLPDAVRAANLSDVLLDDALLVLGQLRIAAQGLAVLLSRTLGTVAVPPRSTRPVEADAVQVIQRRIGSQYGAEARRAGTGRPLPPGGGHRVCGRRRGRV